MERFSDKRELMYLALGLLAFGVLLFVFLYSTNFLVSELRAALNPDLIKAPETVKFNLDQIGQLNLPPVR